MRATRTGQGGLFDPPGRHRAAFEKFHREHPHVYRALRKIWLQVVRFGITRFGIRTVWERLRWLAAFKTKRAKSTWKLNDHYTRHYARLLMEQEPELAGLFEVRNG